MLFYRSSLPLSRQTLQYVTGVVGRHRKQVGSKGRALTAGMQALMTLAYLKNGETFAQLGAGFGVGTTTAWRYVDETVTLLSARSPKLSRALAKAHKDGLLYLVMDGTLIPIDRVKADRPFCRVGTERGAGVATGPFLRAARRTRRAALTAPGSPRSLPLWRG